MATGDQTDIQGRLQQLLPHGWFTAGQVPLRDALLAGAAAALSFVYSLLAYVRLQTRIATASDGFLDMIAADYFGAALVRKTGQSDASFRAAIIVAMFRHRNTRFALISVLTLLTGRAPKIVEPLRPADTGGYGIPTSGYGAAGAYGSELLPYQAFVTAYRQAGTGVPQVAGYGVVTSGYGVRSWGEYAPISASLPAVADADIYAAIESVRPVATILWTRISS